MRWLFCAVPGLWMMPPSPATGKISREIMAGTQWSRLLVVELVAQSEYTGRRQSWVYLRWIQSMLASRPCPWRDARPFSYTRPGQHTTLARYSSRNVIQRLTKWSMESNKMSRYLYSIYRAHVNLCHLVLCWSLSCYIICYIQRVNMVWKLGGRGSRFKISGGLES